MKLMFNKIMMYYEKDFNITFQHISISKLWYYPRRVIIIKQHPQRIHNNFRGYYNII